MSRSKLHAKEQPNRNHGDRNNLEKGKPIIVADTKIYGGNHQSNWTSFL